MIQRQYDLAGALVDGRAGQPAEHRDLLGTGQTDPLHLGVGNVLDIFLDLLVHRAVVWVDSAELEELVDRHLVAGQFGVRRLDHREDVQHQLLLAQREAVHSVLDQVVGLADDILVAALAEGCDWGFGLHLCRLCGFFGVGLGCYPVHISRLGSFFPECVSGCHMQNLIFTTR